MFIIDYIGYHGPELLILTNIILLLVLNINLNFLYLILFGNIFNAFFK